MIVKEESLQNKILIQEWRLAYMYISPSVRGSENYLIAHASS